MTTVVWLRGISLASLQMVSANAVITIKSVRQALTPSRFVLRVVVSVSVHKTLIVNTTPQLLVLVDDVPLPSRVVVKTLIAPSLEKMESVFRVDV